MKHLITIISCLCLTLSVFAQQDLYQWRVGLHGGYFTYYGDLNSSVSAFDVSHPVNDPDSYQNAEDLIAYGLSIERRISDGWSLKLLGTNGTFRATDRTVNYWNGNILPNPDFTRSLNVETKIWDASLMATYHFDDGQLLSKTSWIAPYISFGIGFNHFETAGDLFDANGVQYNYWSDNTIRNQPEGTAASIIIAQDLNFETDLDALRTEGTDYNQDVWNIPVALGLKFRLSDQINLNIEALIRYVNSDYLDDVSGDFPANFDNGLQAYASNPNNITKAQRGDDRSNDYYGFASVSLHYNFGKASEEFVPPIFYTRDVTAPTIEGNQIEEEDGTTMIKEEEVIIEKTIIVNEEGTEITVEEQVIGEAEVTKKIIKIDSTQNVKKVLKELEKTDNIKVIEATKKVETPIKKIEIDTTAKTQIVKAIETSERVVEIPVKKIETEEPVIKAPVEIEKVERPVVKIKEKATKIDAPTALDGLAAEVDYTPEELQLIDVQQTRLEIAQLTESAYDVNISGKTITEKNAEIEVIKSRMDSLELKLDSFEQYNNSLAIRGNNDYSKPENEQIRTSTLELNTEIEELKRKLIISNSTNTNSTVLQQKKLERAELRKAEQAEKIEALQKELSKIRSKNTKLKLKNKKLKIKKSTKDESHTWNPSRVDDEKPKSETAVIIKPVVTEAVVTKPVVTETAQKIEETANQVIEQPIPATAPAAIQNYDSDIQRLNVAVEALKNQEKNQGTITTLKSKVSDLENKLQSIEQSNSQYVGLLQSKINALNDKVKLLEQRKTIVEVPVTIERVITTTPNVTKVLGESFRTTNIFFKKGSAVIDSEFNLALDRLGRLMVENPNMVAILKGFADKSGNAEINFQLSKKRANAVKNYLVRQAISSGRIDITYFGAEKATTANDPFSRRVEVELIIQ